MPKTPYEPTVTDTLTGQNLRALRQRRGETLKQTVERAGFGKDASTLAATERGERLLTDLEATKLAAHFNTTADTIRAKPAPWPDRPAWTPATEQDWLGNAPANPVPMPSWPAPPLFAVPDAPAVSAYTAEELADGADRATEAGLQRLALDVFDRKITIDPDNPLTPEQYRAQVWIPYLEARYTAETKAS